MRRYFLCFVVVFSVLYQTISSNDVNPDDEDEDNWLPFMEKLDEYSGLGSYDETKRHQIDGIACTNTTCIVNVNGDIVWDIRMQLYSQQMAQYFVDAKEDATISLDGCLNQTLVNDYNTCMEQVRTRMISFIEDKFEQLFRQKLEERCDETLFRANCI